MRYSLPALDQQWIAGLILDEWHFILACSSSFSSTLRLVRDVRDPAKVIIVSFFSARSNSRCVCLRPSAVACQSLSSALDLGFWTLVDFRRIDSRQFLKSLDHPPLGGFNPHSIY